MPEKVAPEQLKDAERTRIFIENRQANLPEKPLEEYGEQWVAWSEDGTHIVAASPESFGAVYDRVVAAGIDPSKVAFYYVRAQRLPMPEKATPEELKDMERARTFIENRQAFSLQELAKYIGQWIAWSSDATHIVAASSESGQAVHDLVVAAGIDPSTVVFDYIPGD